MSSVLWAPLTTRSRHHSVFRQLLPEPTPARHFPRPAHPVALPPTTRCSPICSPSSHDDCCRSNGVLAARGWGSVVLCIVHVHVATMQLRFAQDAIAFVYCKLALPQVGTYGSRKSNEHSSLYRWRIKIVSTRPTDSPTRQ